jgi:hypothetical protein
LRALHLFALVLAHLYSANKPRESHRALKLMLQRDEHGDAAVPRRRHSARVTRESASVSGA